MEAFDGLQAWLEADSQLLRVLPALASLLERLGPLEAAAAAAGTNNEEDEEAAAVAGAGSGAAAAGALVLSASVRRACLAKQLVEAERLGAYLGPLMSQLAQALEQVERAVSGLNDGGSGSSSTSSSVELAVAGRALLGMLTRELWRRQGLIALMTDALAALLHHHRPAEQQLEEEQGDPPMELVRQVLKAWPLGGRESCVDVALLQDVIASPSLGLGAPRRQQLQALLADVAGADA